jgi:hypothetical protein
MCDHKDLVAELSHRASLNEANAASYLKKYEIMADFLNKKYYPYIQATCPFYTDHGSGHIASVTWAASKLLGRKLERGANNLTVFDIYVLLTAIIWHDAGMVVKRAGHEIAVQKLLEEFSNIAFDNAHEQRLVQLLITAHSGGSVPLNKVESSADYHTYTVHARALAAVLRFADEISENASRISVPLLQQGVIPPEQQIFWYYAKSIQASRPDLERERIVLTVGLDCEEAVREFLVPHAGNAQKQPLLEYLIARIQKINNERAYCGPHFARYASIQTVEVRLSLLKGTNKVPGYEKTLEFGDPEYPNISIVEAFFNEHPEWAVDSIKRNI